MLMPNGLSQLDGVDVTYGLTGDSSAGPTSPNLPGRSQDVIVAALKAKQVDPAQSAWPNVAAGLFDGLRTGIPLPVALLEKLLQTIFDTVTGDLNNMGEALTAALTAFGDKWLNLDNVRAGLQDIIDFFVNAVNNTVGSIGSGATDFFDAIGNFLNSITQGAEGTAITGSDKVAVKNSIDGLRRGTVANTTAIAKLAAGSGAIDEFNRTATDLGSDWLVVPIGTGTGGPATDGGNAVWRPVYPNGGLDCYCRWQGATLTTSATDYQMGTLVFNSTPGIEYLTGGGIYYGTNSILLRCDASPTIDNYVQAIVRKDGAWVVFSVVANTVHPIASGTGPSPGAGMKLEFYAGELASTTPRRFRLVLDGVDLLPWTTETGTSSVYGASYRGWGFHFGEQSTAFNLGTPAAIPGGINFWTANDQI
jgi:hypothetical protein